MLPIFLKLYRQAYFGPVTNRVIAEAADLRYHEIIVVAVPAVLIVFLGFYPAEILDVVHQASHDWVIRLVN